MFNVPTLAGEQVLNLGATQERTFTASPPLTPMQIMQMRATDPVAANVATPGDYVGQYPIPLDITEIVAMCEEITALQAIPEERTMLKEVTWRELNELAFTSGSGYINFADGACPEEYRHDGDPTTLVLKNIGAKKSLTQSDIMDSMAKAGAMWGAISFLNGPTVAGEGLPGNSDMNTMYRESVGNLKEKETMLMWTLVMNGWDNLLVNGDVDANALAFDGIINILPGDGTAGEHFNDNSASGSFSAAGFDAFLAEGCVNPQVIYGHPQATQGMLSAYFQLGFAGSQVINTSSGDRIVPGFNFASWVNTGRGRMAVVADNNFPRSNIGGSNFQGKLYPLRMTHNGERLVYRLTQIPLSYQDLTPGCTSIAFEIWGKTALCIKHKCAHGVYTSQFSGRVVTTCPVIT